MNVLTAAVSSPFQSQPKHEPTPEDRFLETFALRSAQVDRLIDEKIGYIMESARLRSLAKSNPEQRQSSLDLIRELEEKISRLQCVIDRELKGLFYSLQKAPPPSPFLDDLPG